MKKVYFVDDNRNQIVAEGFEDIQEAEIAVDNFLEEQGSEYGRNGGLEHNGKFYFGVSIN